MASGLRLERVVCPLCASNRSKVVLRGRDNLTGMPGEFVVEQCLDCRHRYLNPRPTWETNFLCYPSDYSPHLPVPTPSVLTSSSQLRNDDIGSGESPPKGKRPWYLGVLPLHRIPGLKRLYHWLLDDKSQMLISPPADSNASDHRPSTGDALEVGCATGRYLVALRELGWQVTGVEPMEAPAKVAQSVGLDVRIGTLDTVSLPSQQFDLVAAWMVIEHVPDPRKTLTQMRRLLREGGTLLISVPNAGCWEPIVFGRSWYSWELPRHLQHFTVDSLTQLLRECGFEEVRVWHHRSLLNLFGSLGIAWRGNRVGRWLMDYTEHPRLLWRLASAPLAHFLAWIGQGGRMTMEAKATGRIREKEPIR